MNALENSEGIHVTESKLEELLEKDAKGECTEEEKSVLKAIMYQKEKKNAHYFADELLDTTVAFIDFSQETVSYNPKLQDLLNVVISLSMCSMAKNEDSDLSKYDADDAEMLLEMFREIGDDIFEAWNKTLSTPLSPEKTIMGLLLLAFKIAVKNHIPLPSAKVLAEAFGIDLDSYNSCECNCDEKAAE